MGDATTAVAAAQRAAAAKAKIKAADDALAKANPALAKMKEKQAAKIKAGKAGVPSPKAAKEAARKAAAAKKKGGKGGDNDAGASDVAEEVDADAAAEEERKKKEEKEKAAAAKKKKKKDAAKEEVRELPPDPNPVDNDFTAVEWLSSLSTIAPVISAALQPPGTEPVEPGKEAPPAGAAFKYIQQLEEDTVRKLLKEAKL